MLVALLAGVVRAGDEPATPVASPAEVARAAAAARTGGDATELKRLAGDGGQATLDAIDAAVAAGDPETARALAAAAPAPFAEPLAAYADGRATDHTAKAIGTAFEVAKRLVAAGRGAEGVLVYRRATEFASQHDDGRGVAAGRIYEARVLLGLGRAEEAFAAADAAVTATKRWAPKLEPRAHLERGQALVALERDAEAVEAWTEAYAGFRAANDVGQGVLTLRRIGEQHDRRGRTRLALSAFEAAVEVARPTGDAALLGGALNSVGMVRDDLGDNAGALLAYDEARALFAKGGSELLSAIATLNLGVTRLALDDDKRALEDFVASRETFRRLRERGYEMQAVANIATVHDRGGRPAEALALYDEVLAHALAVKDRGVEVRTLGNRGLALKGLGREEEAIAAFRAQGALAKSLGLGAIQAGALIHEGGVEGAGGRHEPALAAFRDALAVAGPEATAQTRLRVEVGLASVHLERGETAEALAAVRRALDAGSVTMRGLSEQEGAQARQHLAGLFDLGIDAARRGGEPGTVVEMIERGRAGLLRESLAVRRRGTDRKASALEHELEEALRGERASLKTFGTALAAGQRSGLFEHGAAAEVATRRVEDLRARIERNEKAAAGVGDEPIADATALRATLAPDEALVLFSLPKDRDALAIVLRHDGARLVALPPSTAVLAACEAALAPSPGVDEAAMDDLRRRIVVPLALPESATRVLVSPDGPLWSVPLSMLFPGRDVCAVPSGTVLGLLRAAKGPRGTGVLAVGDATFPREARLSALPATRAEVERVGTVRLLGADATKPRLLAELAKHPHWLALHLATHGVWNDVDPLRSALALSADENGEHRWTAAEVLRARVPVDAVVLSACETGLGRHFRAEGVLGLARAFLLAGAPRVVASLWKVEDDATAFLMTRFYERFAPKEGAPLDAAAALRLAQEDVRKEPRWADPRLWAGWVLIGLP